MADFQYQPDMSDPVAKLRLAMDTMDGNIASFLILIMIHQLRCLSSS